MESKTLIQLLNYSRTLIQDSEIKFLFYKQFPTHPEDVGAEHRKLVASWERQLRENPPKSKNPEALRKEILGYLESEKKYGAFRGSKELFSFVEGNLVFQNGPPYPYRMEIISRFENYPSFGSIRFFNGGGLFNFFSNGTKAFRWSPPNQFANDRRVGSLQERASTSHPEVSLLTNLPPAYPIDETQAEVHLSENSTATPVYIITYIRTLSTDEKMKVKVYVQLKAGLPQVFREEFYFKGDSPEADAEGYWLLFAKMYRDFERVEALNITIPRVREVHEFRRVDGFKRRRSVAIIKEMDFNLGLPASFFDQDESGLTANNDGHEKIRGDVQKEESQAQEK